MKDNVIRKIIGIYTVLYECKEKDRDGHKLYHVKCNICGKEYDKRLNDIHKAKECYHVSITGKYIDRYNWSNIRLGKIFRQMKSRCYNESDKSYQWYGGKGIRISQEWIDNPQSFEEWALSHGYKDNLTIDRIDESKNYAPENCRWITNKDNAKYKSTTNIIEVDGMKHTGREWAIILNLGINTVNKLLRKYSEEQVKKFIRCRLLQPNKKRNSNQTWMSVYNL